MARAYVLAMRPLRVPIFLPKSTHSTVLRQRLLRSCPSYVPYTSGFHTTSPRPFPDVFLVARGLLENIHGIEGLPWSASIPFTALFVFAFTRGPIATYLQIVLRRQRDLEPHLHKVRLKLKKTVMRVDTEKTVAERVARVDVLYEDACTAVHKPHNCQHWKLWLLGIKFPVWCVMMETIRRMTGTEKGFIDLVRSAMGKRDFLGFSEPSAFVEPSFATEGPLWFSNLQQVDPYLILPFILSATSSSVPSLVMTLFVSSSNETWKTETKHMWQRPMYTILIIPAIFLAASEWASSSLLQLVLLRFSFLAQCFSTRSLTVFVNS